MRGITDIWIVHVILHQRGSESYFYSKFQLRIMYQLCMKIASWLQKFTFTFFFLLIDLEIPITSYKTLFSHHLDIPNSIAFYDLYLV